MGYNLKDHVEILRPGDFNDDVYTRGRLAFYLKGKIKGRYILTAAADTGEQKLKSIFKGLDDKDPRTFLKRLDPDDYYPVYGDDSMAVEDAPTKGKFYVRLDKGSEPCDVGQFQVQHHRHEVPAPPARPLWCARCLSLQYAGTRWRCATLAVDVHAAMPGTVPQRDVFRGTGGSAYFVKHQDVTPGSDTVSIEVRNTSHRLGG